MDLDPGPMVSDFFQGFWSVTVAAGTLASLLLLCQHFLFNCPDAPDPLKESLDFNYCQVQIVKEFFLSLFPETPLLMMLGQESRRGRWVVYSTVTANA